MSLGLSAGARKQNSVVVPENHLAEIPSNLDWVSAAAVPEAFITAHDALFTQAELRIGETVLVHAAGSGVGTAAIQLGRAAGAKRFRHFAYGRQTGAGKGHTDSVVVLSSKTIPAVLIEAVHEWTAWPGRKRHT